MTMKRFYLDENGIHDREYEFSILGEDELVDIVNSIVDENKQLKDERDYHERKKCEYFNKYNKKHLDNVHLKKENEQLKQENQRMTDKLNHLALEFLNYDMVTMGKATEMSEMSYYDFLQYRKEHGNPMELQL